VAAEPFATIQLKDEELSVSAVWGKSFQSEGATLGHVLDPRSGRPVEGALLAAVALPSATETDAFSTALLVSGKEGYEQLLRIRPQAGATLVLDAEAGQRLLMAQRLEVRCMDGFTLQKQA
jgi:thiamine biosynthesis lipoprotein